MIIPAANPYGKNRIIFDAFFNEIFLDGYVVLN